MDESLGGENYPPPPGRGSICIHYLELCEKDLCFLLRCVHLFNHLYQYGLTLFSSPWELFILLLKFFYLAIGSSVRWAPVSLATPPFYCRCLIFWHYNHARLTVYIPHPSPCLFSEEPWSYNFSKVKFLFTFKKETNPTHIGISI